MDKTNANWYTRILVNASVDSVLQRRELILQNNFKAKKNTQVIKICVI
jgi:hypothetical protein